MTSSTPSSRALLMLSLTFLLGFEVCPAVAANADHDLTMAPVRNATGSAATKQSPAAFTANRGQWPDSILFRANSGGATVWLTRTGIYYEFTTPIPNPEAAGLADRRARRGPLAAKEALQYDRYTVDMIKAEFVGAERGVRILGIGEQECRCNYFLGNDPARWRSDVPNYSGVVYQGLYPGIDLKYSLREGRLEHELVLKSGADASKLLFRSVGSTAYTLDPEGYPVATHPSQETSMDLSPMEGAAPWEPHQGNVGSRARVNLPGPNAATVSVTLTYSTYLGGSNNDDVRSVDVDDFGRACVAGFTQSADFPTLNTVQGYQTGTHDAFVTELNAAGNAVLFSTYFGGTGDDDAIDLAIGGGDTVYVTGITSSTDFPTVNPFQAAIGGMDDAFVVKFAPSGAAVTYSTYLGSSDIDFGTGIAVDVLGHAFVLGTTYSADFPTVNPFQADQPDVDLFITKLDVNGDALFYSTYLGGTLDEYGDEIAVDGSGSAYVTGVTYSTDFPTQNPYQTDQGAGDAIVAKLSANGNALDYSTYLGGGDEDFTVGVAVDSVGNAYVDGYTLSTDFPTQSPYQTPQGNFDAFAAKLNATGDALLYSTYIGGNDTDYAYALALDGLGNAYISGYTSSADFPLQSPYQTDQPGPDAFVMKLGPTGNYVAYSTYLGGNDQDYTIGLATDDLGSVYMAGSTVSTDFPTLNPFQTYQGTSGLRDGFVAKLSDQVTDILKYILYSPVDMVVTDPVGDSIGVGFNTILNGSTYDTLLDVNGDLDPDDSVTIPNPIAGQYRVRILPEAGAVGSDKFTFAIRINGNQQLVPDGYRDQSVSALGTTVPDTVIWTETPTVAGDCDANGTITSADIIFLVNYVFKSGAGPAVPGHGDVNCDELTTSADIIYLVNYVFKSSLSPCSQSGG